MRRSPAAGEEVTGQIGLVQALHDDDDLAALLVVEARGEFLIEVGVDLQPMRLGVDVLGAVWVVNDDNVGPVPGDCRTN